MKKARKAAGRTILRSWLISYSMILLLPMILNLVIFDRAKQAMQQDYQNTQYTALNNLADTMEREWMRLNEFSSKIANNDNVMDLFTAASMDDYKADFQSSLALQNMENSLFLSLPQTSIVKDYYLFSPTNNLIWASNGLYEESDPLLPNQQFIQNAKKRIHQSFSGPLLIWAQEGKPQQHAILYPLPSSYEPTGFLLVTLDNNEINSLIRQAAETAKSRLYLTDSDGAVLYRSIDAKERPTEEKLLLSPETTRGNSAWLYTLPSTTLSLRYAAIAPIEADEPGLSYLQMTLLFSLLIGILGGGFLIFILARKNYSPVQALVDTVSMQSDQPPENAANEYQLVSEALRGLYEQRNSIQAVVSRQNKTLYSYYLSELMKNRLSTWEMDETLLQDMESNLGLEHFCLLIVLTDFSNEESEHEDLVQTAFSALYESHFLDAFKQFLGSAYQVTSARIYDYEACLISVPADHVAWQEEVRTAADTAARQYSQSVPCRNYLACSSLYHGIEALPKAYEEVSELMPYAVMSSEKTMFREETPQPSILASPQPEGEFHALQNLIRTGSGQELKEKLLEIVERYSSQNYSFHTIKGICAGLICQILLSGSSWNEEERSWLLHRLSRLDKETTLDKVRDELGETAEMAGMMKKKPEALSRREALILKVEKVLEEHLYDPDLNIMFLARSLDMNPKYLSSVYQEATGNNLMDVIHKRRVGRFKELMLEENLSVKDAAAQVGYTSVVTLNRWFKKFEGVTPGKWKEN